MLLPELDRPLLEARGVCKRFGPQEVLTAIDLVARPGELHGLLGPNGAGKTTLMRILLGLVRRDAGTVRLLGRDVASMAATVPDGVAGFIDTPGFYPYMSGRQNLALLARLDGGARSSRRDKIIDALEQVGLGLHADRSVAGYSAGMRQRLGLAAALLRAPRLLFLDEPTSSLDPAGARDIRSLARRLADQGSAVVLSSHDMIEVEELCTMLTVVDRGRVVFSGTVDQLRRRAPAAVHRLRTSDDAMAVAVACQHTNLRVAAAVEGGLELSGDSDALDAYTIALGRSGVAIRVFEPRPRSLESMFLHLTNHPDALDARPRMTSRPAATFGAGW